MSKITVDQVREAYERIGMKAIKKTYYHSALGCCPIGALMLSTFPEIVDRSLGNDRTVIREICRHANNKFGEAYVLGFINAVDDRTPDMLPTSKEYQEGYEDGREMRKIYESYAEEWTYKNVEI